MAKNIPKPTNHRVIIISPSDADNRLYRNRDGGTRNKKSFPEQASEKKSLLQQHAEISGKLLAK
jgi:hypothetical protein